MQAIIARERAAGIDGLALGEMPYPHAAENDVIVRVHAAGFTPGELDWPGTWTDRAGRDRTPTIPGHEVSGVVAELGYGTTGLTVGQRVFGVTDWCRNGTLAEFVAVEARNLAPLSAGVDHIMAAALPISGLTAWQGLFTHGQLQAGQTVLIHGAAGGVGSVAVQLAREAGARVIGTGRAANRETVLGMGAEAFVDLDRDRLEDIGEVDMVLDVIGGQILCRSAALVRSGGALVSIAEPPPSSLTTDGPFSSSSNPIAQGLSNWSTGLETGGCVHSSERYNPSKRPLPHSARPAVVAVRRSSESSMMCRKSLPRRLSITASSSRVLGTSPTTFASWSTNCRVSTCTP